VYRRSWLPQDLRAYHRGLLLRLMAERGALTRREMAEFTGMSIPTVASIAAELLAAGHVTEAVPPADVVASRGPRATVLALASDSLAVIGVEVGVDRLRVAACDLSGVASEVTTVPLPRGGPPQQVLALAVEAARPLAQTAGDRLLGAGIAVPGPVDPQGRLSRLALPLGWRDIPVAEPFETALGVPAVVEYNVRAMAVAEARHGLGRSAENLLYVHLGKSIGIAFVVDGRPFRQGAHGVPELGHQRVVDRGPRCSCGETGCLEAVLGEDYLRRRLRGLVARDGARDASPARRGSPVLDLLEAAVRAGNDDAAEILDDVVGYLSTAIGMSANVLSPARIALGGDLASASGGVLDRIVDATRAKVSQLVRDQMLIERSAIGRYPGLLGAGTVALDRLFYRDHEPLPGPRPAARPRGRDNDIARPGPARPGAGRTPTDHCR
jgi:predicted NBD/HSP70 family sugar kinase